MSGEELKIILMKHGVKIVDLANLLNYSQQNTTRLLKVTDVKSGTLERISELTNIPILEFYGGAPVASIQGDHNTQIAGNRSCNIGCPSESDVAVLKERIAHLEALVAEKERLIGILLKSK